MKIKVRGTVCLTQMIQQQIQDGFKPHVQIRDLLHEVNW